MICCEEHPYIWTPPSSTRLLIGREVLSNGLSFYTHNCILVSQGRNFYPTLSISGALPKSARLTRLKIACGAQPYQHAKAQTASPIAVMLNMVSAPLPRQLHSGKPGLIPGLAHLTNSSRPHASSCTVPAFCAIPPFTFHLRFSASEPSALPG